MLVANRGTLLEINDYIVLITSVVFTILNVLLIFELLYKYRLVHIEATTPRWNRV